MGHWILIQEIPHQIESSMLKSKNCLELFMTKHLGLLLF